MQQPRLFKKLQTLLPIDEAQFEQVAKHFQTIQLNKHELWEKEGKISEWMGFVNSGLLRQYMLKDGQEFTIEFSWEGDFVGNHLSFQTQTPSTSNMQALEPCELLVMPFQQFMQFYQSIPATQKTAELIGLQKQQAMAARNSSLLIDSPEERYIKLLNEKPSLINRVPQYLIAQYLGIRPESLSRIRKRYSS